MVEDVLSEEAIEEVRSTYEEVAVEMKAKIPYGNRGEYRYSFGVAQKTRQMLHHRSVVGQLLNNSFVAEVIQRYYGEGNVVVWGGGGELVCAQNRQFQELHSDIAFGDGESYVSETTAPHMVANFLLEDQAADFGATRLLPGTFMRRENYDLDDWETQDPWWQLAPLPRGAVILRDSRCLHSGAPNYTDRDRILPNVEFLHRDYAAQTKSLEPCLPREFVPLLSQRVQAWVTEELILPDGADLGVADEEEWGSD